MMQYPELFSQIYQLRIRVLLEISISDTVLKQQVMGRIFERGKQIYETDPAALTEDKLADIAKEEIQELISVPTGVDATTVLQDMTEEEQKTTILLYQENRNAEEIAEELKVSGEKAEALIASVKDKIEKKLGNKEFGDGITALGLLIGMFRAQPVTVLPAAVPAAIVTPGISAAVPAAIEAGGHGGAVSAASSTVSSTSVSASASQAAAVSGGKAVQSSVVYGASNAGPASTAAGTTSAAAAKTAAAGTAAKTAAAAGGATAAKVAATAAVAVTVVGGGGYAGYKYYESRTNEPEPAPEVIADPEKEEEISTPVPTEVIVEETEEPAEAVWIKEPQFEFDTVEPLVTMQYTSREYYLADGWCGVNGYPQEWVKNEILPGGEKIPEYTADAAEFVTGNTGGVVSYDGETLISGLKNTGSEYGLGFDKTEVVAWQPFTGYMNDWEIALRSDFTGRAEWDVSGGVGDPQSPFVIVYRNGSMYDYAEYEEYQNDPGNKSEIGPYHSEVNAGLVVRVFDDNWNDLGYGYVTNDHGPVMCPEGEIITPFVVNGFYAVTQHRNEEWGKWNTRFDTCAWVNAETGKLITGYIYEDTWFFEDGYCPVKKNGYWGFIDEEGKEVTDFVFEDASTLYNGRAFVKVNGKFGILDIAETIDRYGYISSEMIKAETAGSEKPEAGQEEPVQVTAGDYEAVLQAYRDCLNAKTGGSTYSDPDNFANTLLVDMYDTIRYALYDIDSNGTDELIVAGIGSGYTDIGGIYSVFNGQVIILENDTVYRNGINILSNGILKRFGSWGWAWTRYTYYRIDPETGSLTEIDQVESDYEKYPGTPWLHNGQRLTDEEMQELTKQYEAEEVSPDYKPL